MPEHCRSIWDPFFSGVEPDAKAILIEGPDAKARLCMARNLRPKGVSSTAGRGDTPRLAAAIVAHLVGAVVVVVVAVLLLLLLPLLLF